MADNAPGPTVIDVGYTSVYGPHIQRLHTRAWSNVSDGHPLGGVPRWSDDEEIDVLDMLTTLIGKIANFHPTTTTFNTATVLTQATPTSALVPRASVALADLGGSVVTPGWTKAAQQTVTYRSIGNGSAKIVMLDFASLNNWEANRVLGTSGDLFDLTAAFTDLDSAWSAEDDTRPSTFLGNFKTLNEKLRKAYRMT